MTGFLLDTNVLSEFSRRGEPDARVKRWLTQTEDRFLFTSVGDVYVVSPARYELLSKNPIRRAGAWRPRPGAICSWRAAQSICSQLGRSLWRTHFACRVSTLRDAGFVPGVVGAEWIMDTDELNTLVTDAIWRAQDLESRGVCAAAGAWLEVSSIEEQLAAAFPASDCQGGIARRGAVRAALKAGDRARANALADRYFAEEAAPESLKVALREILE
jgi:hypothetical protein